MGPLWELGFAHMDKHEFVGVSSLLWDDGTEIIHDGVEQSVGAREAQSSRGQGNAPRGRGHEGAHQGIGDHGDQQLFFNGRPALAAQMMQAQSPLQRPQIQFHMPAFRVQAHDVLPRARQGGEQI